VPREFAHDVIRTVTVRTDAPVTIPFIGGGWLTSRRRTTETRIVGRQLLFAPGQRVDTTRVAETLRRLRDQQLYTDVVLTVERCADSDTVDLTVTTRDAWTLLPIIRVVPPSTLSLGLQDRNLLGTARAFTITEDETARGHGGSFAAVDPWLFGNDVVGAFRFSDVAGTHLVRASLSHRELSEIDPWRAQAAINRQTFGDLRALEHPIGSFFVVGQIGHLIGGSVRSITVPYVGAEFDSAKVLAIRAGDAGTPTVHGRAFLGADMGVLHRAAQFDTVSWFVPGRGFLDIPLGVEGDVLIAPGWDRAQDAGAARYDTWLGRMWIPHRGQLVTTDAWTSGFVGNVRANHIDRLALAMYQQASRGFWGGRAMFEQLLQLDPDQRAVSLINVTTDPSFAAVPRPFRLADRAFVWSLERSIHLLPVARASMLDGGAFTASSLRWDRGNAGAGRFGVAVVGVRLRFLSANGGIMSTRVDLALPVAASGGAAHHPLLSVSFGPLFDASRQRDGRRRQQP
jgi:hypothetical protein